MSIQTNIAEIRSLLPMPSYQFSAQFCMSNKFDRTEQTYITRVLL